MIAILEIQGEYSVLIPDKRLCSYDYFSLDLLISDRHEMKESLQSPEYLMGSFFSLSNENVKCLKKIAKYWIPFDVFFGNLENEYPELFL